MTLLRGQKLTEEELSKRGICEMQKKKKRILGKKSRAAGARFELKVRSDLEKEGWVVDKWTNNVDLEEGKLVKARPKFVFNPKLMRRIPIGMSLGFPDFIAFRPKGKNYEIVGVEVKTGGSLDKEEKEKCRWFCYQYFRKYLII